MPWRPGRAPSRPRGGRRAQPGRARPRWVADVDFTAVPLGSDYPNQTLVVGYRKYDGLGRVLVAGAPFSIASGQAIAPSYATTYYFNADGTPSCFVQGPGQQPFTTTSNESSEIFPTCFTRTFQDNTEVVSVKDAASLLTGSPQAGVQKSSYATAIGRVLTRSTWQGGTRLEHAMFSYDRLGHRTGMTRYQDASAGANPVTSSWHFDSLGQMVEIDEPDSARRFRTYSNWGELKADMRTISGPISRMIQYTYDPYSRLVHSEEGLGVSSIVFADGSTIRDYRYDLAVDVAPQVTAVNVLGRLAQATSPTGSVSFSYDALGAVSARVFTDQSGGTYVETHTTHADGTPSSLDLFLPDTAFADEHVDYLYDSAGRGKSVRYSNGSETADLFEASTIDTFGRLRKAQFGQTSYSATYADVGRQLLSKVSASSPQGCRMISFGGYDPLGRERSRTEARNGASPGTTTTFTYDPLGQLSHAVQTTGGATLFDQSFTYDSLGNIVTLSDAAASAGPTTTTLSYSGADHDRDRICRIAYESDSNTACNVTYDEVGSIVSQQTPTGTRTYRYYADGNVLSIGDGKGSSASFRYDAFGEVQELDLTSNVSSDTRHDRRYGDLISWRDVTTGGATTSVLSRKIPGPHGFSATRRGAGGPWVFEFGEARGNRFFTDASGNFVQDVDYQPFGTATSTGAQPGTNLYSNEQWNSGDALAAFGISKLGARLYDPAIGRFVSRDPLLIPRTAATTNAYAFAVNDPVNCSDRRGMDVDDDPADQGREPLHNEDRGSAGGDYDVTLELSSEVTVENGELIHHGTAYVEPRNPSGGFSSGPFGTTPGDLPDLFGGSGGARGIAEHGETFFGRHPVLKSLSIGAAIVGGAVLAATGVGLVAEAIAGGAAVGTVGMGEAMLGGAGAMIATHPDEVEEGAVAVEEEVAAIVEGGGYGNWPTIGETPGGAVAQLTEVSCGPACGEMVAGIPQSQLIDKLELPTYPEALGEALGAPWKGGFVDESRLPTLLQRAPFIAHFFEYGQKKAHFVVVDGIEDGQILIRDPGKGGSTYRMTMDAFRDVWTLYGVFRNGR